ncbi:MAG: sensor domain-containing diguanylate cyclase [Georgfuchsia sp.]
MQLIKTLGHLFGALRSVLYRLTEHYFLFPIFAVLMLGVIWGTTWNLITVERNSSELAAAGATRELAETYEAQMVRALREIDQTLKFVKYAYEQERKKSRTILGDLKVRALLPPDLLFSVSIADSAGKIVASTRPAEAIGAAHLDVFGGCLRYTDEFVVSLPWKREKSGEWALCFSRRLTDADGTFAGVVMVTVDAAHFTSGYEPSKLGEHGVLGLLGTDGVFRVRRTGDVVSAGGSADFATMVTHEDDENFASVISANPWDGVRRYTDARKIYDFPLAVIVGLSEAEQLAEAHRNMRNYQWRAVLGSALLILVITLLWRMSRQLALVRQHEADVKVAYAKKVEYLAYHDGLTGLPNRSFFGKLLDQSISQARRYKRQLAVLFLDLDCFKQINDMLGHDAGDELLKEVAVRLKDCLRDSDTVARLGGDEFVVLIPELEDKKSVATTARKMLLAIARPFNLLGQEHTVTVSIGISVYPQDGVDEQMLKKNADIAMYWAKEEGRNNFRFYSEKPNAN